MLYIMLFIAAAFLFQRMPTSYLPDEDQGVLMVQAMLPSGSTVEQTRAVMDKITNYFLTNEKDAVESVMSVAGISFSGQSQNVGMGFVKLKDWDLRQRPDLKVKAIAGRAMGGLFKYKLRQESSPFPRRPCLNWAMPPDLISSSRTVAA